MSGERVEEKKEYTLGFSSKKKSEFVGEFLSKLWGIPQFPLGKNGKIYVVVLSVPWPEGKFSLCLPSAVSTFQRLLENLSELRLQTAQKATVCWLNVSSAVYDSNKRQ